MAESVKWWSRRCYEYQAKKTVRHTVRWPLVPLPLPYRPGEMVYFDVVGQIPKNKEGHEYTMLVVDAFSRHAEL